MTIKVGDKITNEPLTIPSKEKGAVPLNLEEFSKGKKIVVFAFTTFTLATFLSYFRFL
jgi:hypothetical protein